MIELKAIGILVLLFTLRCVAPLIIMFTIGYVMNYFISRWQEEEVDQPNLLQPEIVPSLITAVSES